jgi:hypothetical protein
MYRYLKQIADSVRHLFLVIGLMIAGVGVAQSQTDLKITSAVREYYPEDSIQIFRTTYRVVVTGAAKIKKIEKVRVEDWLLSLDKPLKRIVVGASKPLEIIISCMEDRGALRTEWMHTLSYGPREDKRNLYVILSERLKDGAAGLPAVEITYKKGKSQKKISIARFTDEPDASAN